MPKRKWSKLKNDRTIESERRHRKQRIENRQVKKTTTTTEKYSAEEFKDLVCDLLFSGTESDNIRINYDIREVGGCPMDSFRGTDTVVSVTFIIEEE